jgi:hypothetical protein
VAAAWAGLAFLLYCLFARRLELAALGVIGMVPWIAVDMLWQAGLDKQLDQTREAFAGKNAQEKHLADLDAPIYRYAMRLKEDLLPQEPARIFIVQNSAEHHYLRLKAQYYLLPHNAYNFGDGPPGRFFRAGDYVLVLTNVGDPTYRARSGKLLWRSGKWVPAELLDRDPLGELYRVSDQQVSGG